MIFQHVLYFFFEYVTLMIIIVIIRYFCSKKYGKKRQKKDFFSGTTCASTNWKKLAFEQIICWLTFDPIIRFFECTFFNIHSSYDFLAYLSSQTPPFYNHLIILDFTASAALLPLITVIFFLLRSISSNINLKRSLKNGLFGLDSYRVSRQILFSCVRQFFSSMKMSCQRLQ